MILEDPGIVEEGLRVLDGLLRAGARGFIDLLAVDASGTLVVLEIDREGEEELFHRSLDHHGWVASQAMFLRRLYGGGRIDPFRSPRVVLLSHQFSPGLLQKIAYLKIAVRPLLYRLLVAGDELALYLEPATGPPGEAEAARAPSPARAEMPAPAPESERLSSEELDALYRFEQRRMKEGKEKETVDL